MNPSDSDADDRLADLLAAYDEALAEGRAAGFLSSLAVPHELRERWQQAQECLDQLEAAWAGGAAQASLPLAGAFLPRLTQLGRFTLERELGRGSFGIVYLAHDPLLQRAVALKVPRLDTVLQPELQERFTREARAAGSLDHPNIVPVFETGTVATVCYIVSAYCPGITLAARLKQPPPPSCAEAADLLHTLAGAIQHAHDRGILHRDLKPANVLLQVEETQSAIRNPQSAIPPIPKITDFGLAKLLEEASEMTQSSMILGTPSYMAPEQATGRSKDVGPATDVYALGTILYEMLAGRLPFLGSTLLETLDRVRSMEPVPPRALRPEVPIDLETICLKCLRKEPALRYASAQELADDLARWRAGKAVLARPVRWPERLGRWCRQRARIRDAGLITVLINVIVAAWVSGNMFVIPTFFADDARGFVGESLAVSGFHLLVALLGAGTMLRKPWAIWASVIVSGLLMLSPLLALFGLPAPFGEYYDQYPLLRWLIFELLAIVFTFQFAMNCVALLAHRTNRPPRLTPR